MTTTLTATYAGEKDTQIAINLLTEHGFDSENVNVVMLDRKKAAQDNEENLLDEVPTIDELTEAEDSDDEVAEVDEEDFTEPTGLIDPIASINLGENNIDSFGDGDFMLGGPILEILDEDSEASEEVKLTEVLIALGIADEELEAYESRLQSGEVLVSIVVDTDDVDEYREVLGAGEPTTLEISDDEEDSE